MSTQVIEKHVTIPSEYSLAGSITTPEEASTNHPGVLILPGSGESDRDGNNGGMDMNFYKDLANFLTENGCITLRFDKRGMHQSEGDKYTRGFWDMVDDGLSSLHYLKQHPSVDPARIIILGHSEGTLLAPAINSKEPVDGMIFLSGGVMRLNDINAWGREKAYQALHNAKGFKGWLYRTFNLVEKVKMKNKAFDERVRNSNEDVIRYAGQTFPAKWMREHANYDVSFDLEKVMCPTLIIGGTKDVHVPEGAAQKASELVQGETKTHMIDDLTHILRKWDRDLGSVSDPFEIYREQLQDPLDEEALKILRRWLEEHFKNK